MIGGAAKSVPKIMEHFSRDTILVRILLSRQYQQINSVYANVAFSVGKCLVLA